MYYFTSDWHFGHKNIIEACNRPFSTIEEMNQTLLDNYKKVVKPEDTAFFLGDIFLSMKSKQIKSILDSLPGTKILVKGNHDVARISQGWCCILERCELRIGDHKLLLSHYPYSPTLWQKVLSMIGVRPIRFIERRPKDEKGVLVHGHVHAPISVSPKYPRQIDIGVDAWNFKLVSQNEILTLVSKNKWQEFSIK